MTVPLPDASSGDFRLRFWLGNLWIGIHTVGKTKEEA